MPTFGPHLNEDARRCLDACVASARSIDQFLFDLAHGAKRAADKAPLGSPEQASLDRLTAAALSARLLLSSGLPDATGFGVSPSSPST